MSALFLISLLVLAGVPPLIILRNRRQKDETRRRLARALQLSLQQDSRSAEA
jgi:hypothetical protein